MIDGTVLDHQGDASQCLEIDVRMAVDHHQVGALARLEDPPGVWGREKR